MFLKWEGGLLGESGLFGGFWKDKGRQVKEIRKATGRYLPPDGCGQIRRLNGNLRNYYKIQCCGSLQAIILRVEGVRISLFCIYPAQHQNPLFLLMMIENTLQSIEFN